MELPWVVGLPGVEELVGAQLPCLECGEQFCLAVGRRGPDHDGSEVVVPAVDAVGVVVPVLQAERAGVVGAFPALLPGLGVGWGGDRGDVDERSPAGPRGRYFGDQSLAGPQRGQLVGGPERPLPGGRARIALLVACNL